MSDVQQALGRVEVDVSFSPRNAAKTNDVTTIRNHILALTAQVEALRRDAARYQLVRVMLCSTGRRSIDFAGCTPEKLDAALDKAMQDYAARQQEGKDEG